jgi:hypothetical protein
MSFESVGLLPVGQPPDLMKTGSVPGGIGNGPLPRKTFSGSRRTGAQRYNPFAKPVVVS